LNPIYKKKVKEEIDRMLEAGIIEPVTRVRMDQSNGDSGQENRWNQICVDLRKLNDAFLHDPFPTPFTDEVLENVGGHEAYSFTDGFFWVSSRLRLHRKIDIRQHL
jgi:hypothetical protein